ncbi:MAG TPA: hypothetical protein VMZ03_05240 [Chitinophagaceae bacterium]|nr:hypothetical protein [Chitinophagaceae bacterium]
MQKLLLLILTVALVSCRSGRSSYRATDMSAGLLRNVIAECPLEVRETAVDMIRKYGQPYEMTSTRLTWENNGPWLKTVVALNEMTQDSPEPRWDFLEQTISYKASADKYDILTRFDAKVTADKVKGTLTAKSDKEELNLLALNLAHDIISGKRTVQDANDQYAWGEIQFRKGRTAVYMQGLQFVTSLGEGNKNVSKQ